MLTSLSNEQKQAVLSNVHTLVTACPGSGKTRVLSIKTAHILSSPNAFVTAVTFTRDSAQELEERIKKMAGESVHHRFSTGTFHALALKQLRDGGVLRGIRLISDGQRFFMIKRIWENMNPNMDLDSTLAFIDNVKSQLNPDFIKLNNAEGVGLYKAYQDMLEREKSIDFSDILLKSISCMESGTVLPIPCTHMLVDEAQDMDEVQYKWITLHSSNNAVVTLVGDDDQSIYGFRFALGFEGLMRFLSEHNAVHVSLSTNYRSKRLILQHSARLIAVNNDRVDKKMQANASEQGSVSIKRFFDRYEESVSLADHVQASPKSWGILTRTNMLLDAVELSLSSRGLSYKRIGGQSFWEKPEPAAFLGLLASIAGKGFLGYANALAWAGIPEEILKSTNGQQRTATRLKLIHEKVLADPDLKHQAKIVKSVMTLAPEWKETLKKKRENLVIKAASVWIASFAGEKSKDTLESCSRTFTKLKGSILERIHFLTQQKDDEKADIILMTIHASKGLEFDNVWIVGCEEGKLPHREGNTDEERRLAYVAMTRARNNLYLSFTTDKDATVSRFIEEAGLQVA